MTGLDQQSNKAEVTARVIRLTKLFTKLPEFHQQALLNNLEEWLQTSPREHSRKPCFVAVDYGTPDRVFRAFIRNIGAGGVFIETGMPLPVGQEIILTFSSSNYETPIKTTGKIAWRGSQGFGVKFKTEKEYLEPMIKAP